MLIDVDQFKSINDKFGHAVGDDVLINVAQIILSQCPDDAIIGRLGGDEFIVVIPEGLQNAKQFAQNINAAVNNLDTIITDLQCSVSIGLATLTKGEQDIRSWFEAADKALYKAKKSRSQHVDRIRKLSQYNRIQIVQAVVLLHQPLSG
ncbi:hypothetical protein GCM10011365_16310 [Marinicella pacifica]|uniref:diguanylate cyclase n=1 Tax=Marinicella pacifica TaxID=1171543 RepID=A0A917CRB4_9GAMM|nr:GGDEF domain-containing protein [Marinicella pacifica]GGF95711.1 hypothetical protein GCM10011365_16310 [Marinicella pacifica]